MAQTPEGKTKRIIRDTLKKRGVFFFMPPANGYGVTGVSDFLGVHHGRFFAIEAKAGSNKPTALQFQFMINVQNAGGLTIWVNEVNAEAGVNLLVDELELWARENYTDGQVQ